ncbi:MAG: hypothetical protein Q8S27_19030, partial [Hoeflea sp.]|nr:hypothetical protein [Hoeflea sp.]
MFFQTFGALSWWAAVPFFDQALCDGSNRDPFIPAAECAEMRVAPSLSAVSIAIWALLQTFSTPRSSS